jgi:hypothetical protein
MAASLRVSFEIDGARELDRTFVNVIAVIDKPARRIAPTFRAWAYRVGWEQFGSEGAKGRSGKWPDRSKGYQERLLKSNPFALNILQVTGGLKLSLTRPDAKYAVWDVSDNAITFGTTHPAAIFHQRGTSRMPARPPIDPSETQQRGLMKDIQRDILVEIRRTGLVVTTLEDVF